MNDGFCPLVAVEPLLRPDLSSSGGATPYARVIAPHAALALMLSSLSSSSTRPEDYWAAVFYQSTTTLGSVPDTVGLKGGRSHQVMPSTAEQLAGVQSFFGLSKTQLAQVCKVQRQTVYDWYAGNFEAEGRNARRLAELYGIIEQLRRDGRKPLPSRVVARALLSGSSLLDLLSTTEVDGAAVGAIVAQLDETAASMRSRGAAAMRERLGWPASSSEAVDANLETNLNDFVDG